MTHRDVNVVVSHAHALGNTAVVRSLGRAGFRVHAFTDDPTASILKSRFVTCPVVTPAYTSPEFATWVLDYVRRNDVRLVVPSEGFLVATNRLFAELAPLMPLPQDWRIVERSFAKTLYFDDFLRSPDPALRCQLPPSLVVWRDQGPPRNDELAALGLPLYIKADEVLDDRGQHGGVVKALNVEDAAEAISRLSRSHRGLLVQGDVPGVKATYNACLHKGELLAESMCVAMHEAPHSGGLTVLRRTWWHEGIRDDALRRLAAMQWDGVAMMEYKWNARDQSYHFIEANTRFWAALHLDLFAGTDFPLIQAEAFLGLRRTRAPRQRLGVIARHTVPGETSHVISKVRDPDVSRSAKAAAIVEFFLLFLDPRVKADLWFPGDRRLYLLEWQRFLASTLKG